MTRLWLLVMTITMVMACSKSSDKPADKPPDQPAPVVAAPADASHSDRHKPVIADAPPLALDVTVKGKVTTWHKEDFDKVVKYTKGTDGSDRDVWSMRELAHTLVGPKARVISVADADGSTAVDVKAWDDATKTPILHTTRRGTLKFTWADGDGKWGETVVKDVVRLEIVP